MNVVMSAAPESLGSPAATLTITAAGWTMRRCRRRRHPSHPVPGPGISTRGDDQFGSDPQTKQRS